MVKDHSDRERYVGYSFRLWCHMGYSFRLGAKFILCASSHRQDNTYHSLCYTSRGALAGTRNSSMGLPNEGSIRWPIAPWANALTSGLTTRDWSDEPPHNEQTLYRRATFRSYTLNAVESLIYRGVVMQTWLSRGRGKSSEKTWQFTRESQYIVWVFWKSITQATFTSWFFLVYLGLYNRVVLKFLP